MNNGNGVSSLSYFIPNVLIPPPSLKKNDGLSKKKYMIIINKMTDVDLNAESPNIYKIGIEKEFYSFLFLFLL